MPATHKKRSESDNILQAARVVVGHCPECGEVIVLLNNYECWPPARCVCGWAGASFALRNHVRLECGGKVGES